MSARRVYPVYSEQQRRESYRSGFALPFIIIAILLPIILLAAWSPWVTESFAKKKILASSPCEMLAVVPVFTFSEKSKKTFFGRTMQKVNTGACGTFDYFVSAIGTLYRTKTYDFSVTNKEDTTPDETVYPDSIGANWKTYKSDSGKFSLKYPLDWSVKVTSAGLVQTYISNGKASIYWRTNSPTVDFDTLYNYPIGVYMQGTKQTSSSSKIKNLQIGSYRGIILRPGMCLVCTNIPVYEIVTYFEIGAPLTTIKMTSSEPINNLQEELFIQILSTFQFLD